MTYRDSNHLKSPISSRDRTALIKGLWNLQNALPENARYEDGAYLDYYLNQCTYAPQHEEHILVTSRSDMIELAKEIMNGASRDQLVRHLSLKYPESGEEMEVDRDVQINNSIDLAVRLVSMVDIGKPCCRYLSRQPLLWKHGSRQKFINDHFDKPIELGNNVKLGAFFNGRNLERIGRFRIDWTSNLADHLRCTGDGDKVVAIFHQATFLKHQESSILPPELVNETRATLALLFPQSDRQTSEWFKKLRSKTPCLDGQVVQCGALRPDDRRIEKFRFWHDRLVLLKEAFDETKPSTIPQFWYDRRNGVQWHTFWVAILVLILTVVFGVVQSVEGALQAYKAYYPTVAKAD
ncbi:hypothetical protein H2200_008296 [Cladophialophora chaetospira]|uniref:Uncharacterized protein n=1 Tax=Cladophialophora chaetospira TaxID=386627 RepID=A0AA39CFZ4_9EURO|nr:hypothetical protein H2200_008296 [Cladophialophora chaetospira]